MKCGMSEMLKPLYPILSSKGAIWPPQWGIGTVRPVAGWKVRQAEMQHADRVHGKLAVGVTGPGESIC